MGTTRSATRVPLLVVLTGASALHSIADVNLIERFAPYSRPGAYRAKKAMAP